MTVDTTETISPFANPDTPVRKLLVIQRATGMRALGRAMSSLQVIAWPAALTLLCGPALGQGAASDTSGPKASAAAATEVSVKAARAGALSLARLQMDLDEQFDRVGVARSSSYIVRQKTGTPLSFEVSGNFLNIVGPPDNGSPQQATLVVEAQGWELPLKASFGPWHPVVRDSATEATDGKTPSLPGKVLVQGTHGTAGNLVSNFADLGLMIKAPKPPKAIDAIQVSMTTAKGVVGEITHLLSYDARTATLGVNADQGQDLVALVGMSPFVKLTVSAPQTLSSVHLLNAPNRIQGRLVDAKGKVVTSLQGRRLVLEDLHDFSDVALVRSDGSFTFPAVPMGAFNLELRELENSLDAQGVVVVRGMGEELEIDLLVTPRAPAGAGVQQKPAAARHAGLPPAPGAPHATVVYRSRSGKDAVDIPKRMQAPAIPPLNACEPTEGGRRYAVMSAAPGVSMSCKGSYEIAKGTQGINVEVTVNSTERGAPHASTDTRYADLWSYNLQLGNGRLFTAFGSIQDTHRRYESGCVDVSAQTAAGHVPATLNIVSTNIGDEAYPTTLSIAFEPC